MNEIDPGIKDLLERARPARRVAGADWSDVLRRSRRGRGRLVRVPTRGALLAAALVVGLGAVAQAETGVFNFIGRGSEHSRKERDMLEARVSSAAYDSILQGLPRGQVTVISEVPATTAARIARVFGGPASRYPRHAGVVVMKGPFTIPLYLQGCQATPGICPVPVGRWAWLAYMVLAPAKKGPMKMLTNARWIRVAPLGQPLPDLHGLGQVIRQSYSPPGYSIVAAQHQGSLKIVARKGTHLTLSPLMCTYSDSHCTTQVCAALARYVAYLGRPHPDETPPATGDFTRVSGDLGGWRGNLVITPQSLGQAPPALRTAVARGLAALHGAPIKVVPPGFDCVVNPTPCYRTKQTTAHKVVDAMNRHGLDLHKIQSDAIPARFASLLPRGAHVVGAATNAGTPATTTRGFMLTVVFDRAIPFPSPSREPALGRGWGAFAAGNCLTFFRPLYLAPPLNLRHLLLTLSNRQMRRVLIRASAAARADHLESTTAWRVFRLIRAITRTR